MGVLVIISPGCGADNGPPRATVTGNVTLDGEPVSQGTITFFPVAPTTGPAAGGEIKDGIYSIAADRGVVVGTHRVEVQAYRQTGKQVVDPRTGDSVEETILVAPPKYNTKTELEATISSGENTYDVDMSGT